jgi:hypothetical protein
MARNAAVSRSAPLDRAPIRHMAVLAIANRLGANQALGDVIERAARARSVDGQIAEAVLIYYTTYTTKMRSTQQLLRITYCVLRAPLMQYAVRNM